MPYHVICEYDFHYITDDVLDGNSDSIKNRLLSVDNNKIVVLNYDEKRVKLKIKTEREYIPVNRTDLIDCLVDNISAATRSEQDLMLNQIVFLKSITDEGILTCTYSYECIAFSQKPIKFNEEIINIINENY